MTREIDLRGKICPYPVVEIIHYVDNMNNGERIVFFVDDPLAIKSAPEELEEYEKIVFNISKVDNYWQISVTLIT